MAPAKTYSAPVIMTCLVLANAFVTATLYKLQWVTAYTWPVTGNRMCTCDHVIIELRAMVEQYIEFMSLSGEIWDSYTPANIIDILQINGS